MKSASVEQNLQITSQICMSKRLQMLQALSIFVDIIESVYVKKKKYLQVNVWSGNKETILHMSDTDCRYVLAA